jgi:hypothetical protein
MTTKWLRKPQIAERYTCSTKSVERMWKDGRLPGPQYPFGNDIPANTEEELDAHDREAVRAGRERRAAKAAVESARPEINPQES